MQAKPPLLVIVIGTEYPGTLTLMTAIHINTPSGYSSRILNGKNTLVRSQEKSVSVLITLRSYNYAMRMGNRSHTLVMIPQIWNLMLSAGLR